MKWKKIKRFIRECKYALNQLKIPSKKEYWFTVKITSTIILLTGLIGFTITMLFNYILSL